MADLISRTIKRLYEERAMAGGRNVEELLFSTPDNDLSASFRIDRYISTPHGFSYRNLDNQSIVRHFKPGTTELITVPVSSEKVAIDEELEDAVAVGMEATASQQMQIAKNVAQIGGDYMEAKDMTRAKQAIDVVRTGIFPAKGDNGADLGLGYDHNRDGAQDITYDFTAGGATFNAAINAISVRLNATNTPKGNRCIIMGSSWLDKFGTDSGVQAYKDANPDNILLRQQMEERFFNGIDGLFVVGQYKPSGAIAPFWILSYEPGTGYVGYKGASEVPFVPATEAIAFSLNDKTYRINRGVMVLDDNGKKQRAVGDLVMDTFYDNDPVTTWIRSH